MYARIKQKATIIKTSLDDSHNHFILVGVFKNDDTNDDFNSPYPKVWRLAVHE